MNLAAGFLSVFSAGKDAELPGSSVSVCTMELTEVVEGGGPGGTEEALSGQSVVK